MRSWLTILLLIAAIPVFAQEGVDYERDIKPLVSRKCAACHGPLAQEGGLRLDAGSLMLAGGDSGPVVRPGDSAGSLIVERISSDDSGYHMPPAEAGDRLTAQQTDLIRRWIDAGASFPEEESFLETPYDHWSFQRPVRPAIPQVENARIANAIDAFVIHLQRSRGLEPVPAADPHTLLRRVHIDLIGLPPTPQELASFTQNPSVPAWRQVVDDLLDSSSYGERWGRHWMDVWRYSDWDGYKQELRGSQRHIWHWRDWIIDSLNDDKGYDRMVLEMLAADELNPDDPGSLAATGYLARNFHNSNRNIWLDATVEHTAKGFLGLTLDCARCHDHKYDPIAQKAYYQFRAIFEPHNIRADHLAHQSDLKKDALPRAYDADLNAATYVFLAGNDKQPDKENPVTPQAIHFLGVPFEVEPVQLPYQAFYPELRDFRVELQIQKLVEEKNAADAALTRLANPTGDLPDPSLDSSGRDPAESGSAAAPDELKMKTFDRDCATLRLSSFQARWAADRASFRNYDADLVRELGHRALELEQELNLKLAERDVFRNETALSRVQANTKLEGKQKNAAQAKARMTLAQSKVKLESARHALKLTDKQHSPLGVIYPKTSTGRRIALARWIVDRRNPLAARVAVNHIWMRHFGEPIVDNVFDFGLRSPRPVHADLLDWLAVELMENDWSMKHLHRLILNSNTWRQKSSWQSASAERNRQLDPDNRYLWRMNQQRLDAEIIRDSLLAVGHQLDPTMGGPEIDYRQDQTTRRRSIYLRHAYEKQSQLMVTFDAANPIECYRRRDSIIPQQALALVNSPLALTQSRRLARDLWRDASLDADAEIQFLQAAFLQILARPITAEELQECRQFLADQANLLSQKSKLTPFQDGPEPRLAAAAEPTGRARENLVHMLLNHNDFITLR